MSRPTRPRGRSASSRDRRVDGSTQGRAHGWWRRAERRSTSSVRRSTSRDRPSWVRCPTWRTGGRCTCSRMTPRRPILPRSSRQQVVRTQPHALSQLGQLQAPHRLAHLRAGARRAPTTVDHRHLPHTVPPSSPGEPARVLASLAGEQGPGQAIGAAVGLELAGGHHPRDRRAGGALRDTEELPGPHQHLAREPRRVHAEQRAGDH